MFRLVDIGSGFGKRREIRITDGTYTQCVCAVLVKDTDYVREWDCYAFGHQMKMIAEVSYGPELCWSLKVIS